MTGIYGSTGLQKATFAAGCFWGVEERFSQLRGVVYTRTGYTGGDTTAPTYKSVCNSESGHAEAVEIVFDPLKISYDQLLDAFFAMHNAHNPVMQGHNGRGQYRSAIFFHNELQRAAALEKIDALQKTGGFMGLLKLKIHTELARAGHFWEAEPHHQQYHLKQGRVSAEVSSSISSHG